MSLSSSYDTTAASLLLETLALERAKDKVAGVHMATTKGVRDSLVMRFDGQRLTQALQDSISCLARVVDYGNTKRLVFKNNGLEEEELVWHVQGIISSSDLPPFYPTGRTSPQHLVEPSQCLLPPTFVDEDQDGTFMDASNRYFSSRHDNRGGDPVEMTDTIDPTGSLAKMANDTHYYGEENVVQYLERVQTEHGKKKSTVEIQPVNFKRGDIVEIQVTISAVKLQKAQWKLIATLRCITLLDGRFAQSTLRNHVKFGCGMERNLTSRPLKRRSGADPDTADEHGSDMENTTSKIRKMDIDPSEE
ncbi:hypothetical protein DFP72DRAFT_855071 [Ephemerocybe angulata]|uniref:Uncharacterized protein n=1 Tax=Ephemerocybe angulata TaxID=980116 RepID=A0A8H6HGS4_9AGAR|nr:hypothetical protein DFP72DRAFT_855071 [Tulosesus angulatus]